MLVNIPYLGSRVHTSRSLLWFWQRFRHEFMQISKLIVSAVLLHLEMWRERRDFPLSLQIYLMPVQTADGPDSPEAQIFNKTIGNNAFLTFLL